MSDLRALYQEVIVDHSRHPRNHHKMEHADAQAEGFNPLCGDRLMLYVMLEKDKIKDISFEGSGCAISTASASLMTEHLKGRTIAEAEQLFEEFHNLLTQVSTSTESLGKLAVLSGVSEYPSRVKCATLAWHALHSALKTEKSA